MQSLWPAIWYWLAEMLPKYDAIAVRTLVLLTATPLKPSFMDRWCKNTFLSRSCHIIKKTNKKDPSGLKSGCWASLVWLKPNCNPTFTDWMQIIAAEKSFSTAKCVSVFSRWQKKRSFRFDFGRVFKTFAVQANAWLIMMTVQDERHVCRPQQQQLQQQQQTQTAWCCLGSTEF